MLKGRVIIAFVSAVIIGATASAAAFTASVIERQTSVGISYSQEQILEAFFVNAWSMVSSGAMSLAIYEAVALAVAFPAAAGVRRLIRAPGLFIYPAAGAAAFVAMFSSVEIGVAIMFGGVEDAFSGQVGFLGAVTGSKLGFSLQALAGAIAGFVFAVLRPRARVS